MSVNVASRFFAMLSLVALAAAAAAVYWSLRPAEERPAGLTAPVTITGAWLIATTSMLGSLYYSEVAGFEPCLLCWYQRIAMYPLAVVLGVGALRRDPGVWRYSLPLAAIGLPLSAYHYLVQNLPGLGPSSCSATAPCTAAYVWEFGFISIPFMAGAGFAAVIGLSMLARKEVP